MFTLKNTINFMRSIKFRAFDDGKMIYPTGALQVLSRFFRVIREDAILMQFTGLHDKNGKEIYEGDICRRFVKSKSKLPDLEDFWYIVFKEGSFLTVKIGDEPNPYSQRFNEMEVIGNVYENTDLVTPTP
jgi:uncharacterized phage protein (TIGR01671 family)